MTELLQRGKTPKIAAYFCIRHGFDFAYINPIIGSIIGIGVYFLLPNAVSLLDDFRFELKCFVVTPTIVRSPIKFIL